jgi:sigma-B regulation protein RsbU (phosphoserine phosphatase)
MFVTMLAGIYDPGTGRVRLANAGHEPPLLHHPDGTFTAYPAEAPPLGIVPMPVDDESFPEIEVRLDGGTLYVFTDGLTEGYVAENQPLEVEGLKRLIGHNAGRPLAERLRAIVAHVRREGVGLRDDLTILAVDGRQ